MGTEPPKGKEKGKNPVDPPKDPKKTPEPTVEALQEQLDNKNIELQDLGEKYRLSSEEGQKIPKLKKDIEDLKAKLDVKTSSEIPLTNEEMIKKYPDFEELDDTEKNRCREIVRLKKRQDAVEAERIQEKKDNIKKEENTRFDSSFNEILINPEFADDLKGNEQKFKAFCYKDENLGKDMESLVKSFLFDLSKKAKEDEGKENRDGLEEPGGGGKPEPVKEEGYTLAEVADMQQNDPEKHKRLSNAGKLKIIDDAESNPDVGE